MLDSLELEFEAGATQCEYWDMNSGPLQEQKALLTTAFFFFLNRDLYREVEENMRSELGA